MSIIEPLGPMDHGGALALVAEAGWNQVQADWELFSELGAVLAVKDATGHVVATAAILPFRDFAWISMVLVARTHRRQGLATRLLKDCIGRLRDRGLAPVLDATPAGRSVYQPLGFRDGWALTRWRRAVHGAAFPHDAVAGVLVRPFAEADWPQVGALDTQAFGTPRAAVLRRLHARSRAFACVATAGERVVGFLLGRDGRQAAHIGPVVTRDAGIACALLAHALHHLPAAVLIDVLDGHAIVGARLAQAGFAVERGYTRMTLDAQHAFGDEGLMVAIAGPELG